MIALLVTASGLKDVAKWISEKTILQHFQFFFKEYLHPENKHKT